MTQQEWEALIQKVWDSGFQSIATNHQHQHGSNQTDADDEFAKWVKEVKTMRLKKGLIVFAALCGFAALILVLGVPLVELWSSKLVPLAVKSLVTGAIACIAGWIALQAAVHYDD